MTLQCNITDPVPLGTILTGREAGVVRGNAFNTHVLILRKRKILIRAVVIRLRVLRYKWESES
jgi:hypothetical protein